MTSPNENYTSWHVGMKVVCVDDKWRYFKSNTERGNAYPKVGGVYTIREIGMLVPDTGLGLRLVEIKNPVLQWPQGFVLELVFSPHRFRPVQARKTDILIFQSILSNPHKKIHKVEGERV